MLQKISIRYAKLSVIHHSSGMAVIHSSEVFKPKYSFSQLHLSSILQFQFPSSHFMQYVLTRSLKS